MKFYKIGAYLEFVCLEACVQNYLQWIFWPYKDRAQIENKGTPGRTRTCDPLLRRQIQIDIEKC